MGGQFFPKILDKSTKPGPLTLTIKQSAAEIYKLSPMPRGPFVFSGLRAGGGGRVGRREWYGDGVEKGCGRITKVNGPG